MKTEPYREVFMNITQGFSLINSGQNRSVLNNKLPPMSTPIATKLVLLLLNIQKSDLIVMQLNIKSSSILSDQ